MRKFLLVAALAVLFQVISSRSVHRVQEDEDSSVHSDVAKEELDEVVTKINPVADGGDDPVEEEDTNDEDTNDEDTNDEDVNDEDVNDEEKTNLDYRRKGTYLKPEFFPVEDEYDDATNDEFEDATDDEIEDSTGDYEESTDSYDNNNFEGVTQWGEPRHNDEAELYNDSEDETNDDIPSPLNIDKNVLQLLLKVPQNIKQWLGKHMKDQWKTLEKLKTH